MSEEKETLGGMFDGVIENLGKEILTNITPELRDKLIDWLIELEADAKETPNPWDNFLPYFLLQMMGYDAVLENQENIRNVLKKVR